MKKTLAILALALFIGGISVPAIAASNSSINLISLQEDDPKKKTKTEKAKAEKSKEATKSSDCTTEKKSDCSSKCEGESKK
jgi:hypothetical protein